MNNNIGRVVLPLGRITENGSIQPLGTCFAVDTRKFATAAHVTGPNDKGLVAIYGRAAALSDYQDTTNLTINYKNLNIVEYSPVHDIAILEIQNTCHSSKSSHNINWSYFTYGANDLNFDYSLGSSDLIPTGSPVQSLGYPHANHGRLVLTQQSSMVGARVLLGYHNLKIKHVVLNTQTRPGQSGGPVFSEDGRIVCAMIVGGYVPEGVGSISLGGIDPQSLHQTTHAISAEYIASLI